MKIQPANSLNGTINLPGDKSISHRAAIFLALAEGAAETIGANALLADACFVDASETGPHMHVKQACEMARNAGVETLYLTHLWGKRDTEEAMRKEIDFPSAFVVKERGRYCI